MDEVRKTHASVTWTALCDLTMCCWNFFWFTISVWTKRRNKKYNVPKMSAINRIKPQTLFSNWIATFAMFSYYNLIIIYFVCSISWEYYKVNVVFDCQIERSFFNVKICLKLFTKIGWISSTKLFYYTSFYYYKRTIGKTFERFEILFLKFYT